MSSKPSPNYLSKRNEKIFKMRTEAKMSLEEVATVMGISPARVAQVFKTEATRRGYLKPTDKARRDIEQITNYYNKHVSTADIARMYNVSDRFIRILLEQNGVYHKGKQLALRRGTKHNPLAKMDSSVEYLLGFITSAGELDIGAASLILKHPNKKILATLADIIYDGKGAKLVEADDNGYKVKAVSPPIFNSLTDMGLIKNKTSYVVPDGKLLNSFHFWRGYVDGAGLIGFDKNGQPFISVTTDSDIIKEGLIMFMNNTIELSIDPKSGNWLLYITERAILHFFVNKVYLDAPHELRLARNYERALMISETLNLRNS